VLVNKFVIFEAMKADVKVLLKATKEKSRIRIRNPVVRLRGSGPYQNIMDPEQDNQGG